MDKLIINCETGEHEETNYTSEEIAQKEYEANLPKFIQPKSELELIKQALDELILGGIL